MGERNHTMRTTTTQTLPTAEARTTTLRALSGAAVDCDTLHIPMGRHQGTTGLTAATLADLLGLDPDSMDTMLYPTRAAYITCWVTPYETPMALIPAACLSDIARTAAWQTALTWAPQATPAQAWATAAHWASALTTALTAATGDRGRVNGQKMAKTPATTGETAGGLDT